MYHPVFRTWNEKNLPIFFDLNCLLKNTRCFERILSLVLHYTDVKFHECMGRVIVKCWIMMMNSLLKPGVVGLLVIRGNVSVVAVAVGVVAQVLLLRVLRLLRVGLSLSVGVAVVALVGHGDFGREIEL